MFFTYKNTALFAPEQYGFQPCCFHLATPEQIDKAIGVGGCGPGGIGDYFVPDTMYGLNIKRACMIHDWMYHYGVSEPDKELSDSIFLNNMIRIIRANTKSLFLKMLRLKRARTYYSSVKYFGGPAFWDSKNEPGTMAEIQTVIRGLS